MPNKSIEVNVDDNDLEISFTRKPKAKPKHTFIFHYMGIGIQDMTKPDTIDSLYEITQMNKSELLLLEIINRSHIGHTLQTKIIMAEYNLTNKRKLATGIRLWIKKGFIKRIRRQEYMINPYFITPEPGRHEILLAAWNSLP